MKCTIVPSPRLIWLAAVVGFPTVVVEAVIPQARGAAVMLIAVILIAAVVDALLRRRALADLKIELPELLRLVQGREAHFPVTIHNGRNRGRRIRIGFAMPEGVEVQPEEQSIEVPAALSRAVSRAVFHAVFHVDWLCHPQRRGSYKIQECYLESSSPFGLWSVRGTQSIFFEIRVYPNLRDSGALKALRRGMENLHLTRQLGRGREFEKLREYSAGDSSDEIHWKATARRARPITKVFQIERTQEIYVVIDASRLSSRTIGAESALECAIKAALTVGAVTEKRGDLFGIAAFSDRVETFVQAHGGKLHYSACREAINNLRSRPVSPDFEEIATLLRLRLRRRSLIIFLTALDDPLLAEHFERSARLLAGRHRVLAAMLRPSSARPLFHDAEIEFTEDIYRALAGHLGWSKLHELQGTLGRRGVHLALLEPESFAENLVNLYDDVKQRQLL
jgi:uncharacterized protein (DUF58 family)